MKKFDFNNAAGACSRRFGCGVRFFSDRPVALQQRTHGLYNSERGNVKNVRNREICAFFVRLPPRGGSVGDGGGACVQNEICDNLKFAHSPSVALRRHLPLGGRLLGGANRPPHREGFDFFVVGRGAMFV